MSDTEPIPFSRAAASRTNGQRPPASSGSSHPRYVAFDRRELNLILSLYGRKVVAGEWRDYSIDMLADRAVFSVFRRSSEVPLYRIEKRPKLARRQGAFMVIAATGLILKRGHELAGVLKAIDSTPKLAAVG